MKTLKLLLLVLITLPFNWIFAQVDIEISDCNNVSAYLISNHENQKNTFWLEKQIVSGVWSEKQKIKNNKGQIEFKNLEKGWYRVGVINEEEVFKKRKLSNSVSSLGKITSNIFEISLDCLKKEKNKESVLGINIFPNPTKGILNLSIPNLNIENSNFLRFMDISGKLLRSIEIITANQLIDIKNINPGIYFVQILENDLVIHNSKVIIIK